MCPRGSHGARGCVSPDGIMLSCPKCQVTKRCWFSQPNRKTRRANQRVNRIIEDTFKYNDRWNSHYCHDCNVWIESKTCEGFDCTNTCYYFARPEFPIST